MSRVWVGEWPPPQVRVPGTPIGAARRMVRHDGSLMAQLALREMHRIEAVSHTALLPAVTPVSELLGDALFAAVVPPIPHQRMADQFGRMRALQP